MGGRIEQGLRTIAAPIHHHTEEEEDNIIGGMEVIKIGCDLCDKIFGRDGICLLTIGIIGLVVGTTMFGVGTL
jgi:hypothetical protein